MGPVLHSPTPHPPSISFSHMYTCLLGDLNFHIILANLQQGDAVARGVGGGRYPPARLIFFYTILKACISCKMLS